MTAPKVYSIPLKSDLKGWMEVRVQVDVLTTGSKDRIVKLKEDFEVSFVAGAVEMYQVVEESKKLINEGAAVEFRVAVNQGIVPLDEPDIKGATVNVKVKLDLSAMAQLMGSTVSAVTGSDYLGGLVSQYFPQELQILDGSVEVKAQQAVFELTLRKYRWQTLEKSRLTEYVDKGDIQALFASGGRLKVPVMVKKEQQVRDATIQFQSGLPICDVAGELNWLGTTIPGKPENGEKLEREFIVFDIPAAGKPPSDWGASDLSGINDNRA